MISSKDYMDRETYAKFMKAKQEKDFDAIQELFYDNYTNNLIKFEYAKMVIENGDIEHGRSLLLEILRKKVDFYALFELGKVEYALKDYDYARFCFGYILKDHFDKRAAFELARTEIRSGNYEYARELLTKLIDTDSKYFALVELSKLEIILNNYDLARSHLEEVLKEKDDNYALIELGILEYNVGRYVKAMKIFDTLLKRNFHTDYVMYYFGKIYLNYNDIDMCRKYLDPLIDSRLGYQACFLLAKVYSNSGYPDQARKYYNMILNDSKNSYATLELAKMEAKNGNTDLASEYVNNIKKEDEKNTYIEIGVVESILGNYEEAKMYFQKGIDAGFIFGYNEFGKMEYQLGNFDKAREYFYKLFNTKSEFCAYNCLIMLEYKCENYDKALQLLNEAQKKGYVINTDLVVLISKKFNLFFDIDYDSVVNTYSLSQMGNYDKNYALNHIKERHLSNENDDSNLFNDNVNIPYIFDEIQPLLIDKYKRPKFELNDVYIIPYDNIGNNGENFLKVVTIANTKDILTMYPIHNEYECEHDEEKGIDNMENIDENIDDEKFSL